MTTRAGSALLAVGSLAGVSLSLYANVPAAALAAWTLALVGAVTLTKAEESFFVARNGAIMCGVAELVVLAGFAEDTATWIRFAGIVVLLTGAASAYRTAAGEGFRADAAGRIGALTYLTVIPLALATTLVEAGVGPDWIPMAARVLGVATIVTTGWFAAYAALAPVAVTADRTA